jgi:hypothetical protein
LYYKEREKAKKLKTYVPDGILKKFVMEEEENTGLASNSINLDTI